MIALIAALARNRTIGKDGRIPWHLPDDLRYFKELTTGKTIVMGRKTLESLGKPLPNRRNVVLTRRQTVDVPGVEIAHSVEDIFQLGDVMVIGGGDIYAQFLPYADRLYLTFVDCEIDGDTFFPPWPTDEFTLIDERIGVVDERDPLPHRFAVYDRVKAADPAQRARLEPTETNA